MDVHGHVLCVGGLAEWLSSTLQNVNRPWSHASVLNVRVLLCLFRRRRNIPKANLIQAEPIYRWVKSLVLSCFQIGTLVHFVLCNCKQKKRKQSVYQWINDKRLHLIVLLHAVLPSEKTEMFFYASHKNALYNQKHSVQLWNALWFCIPFYYVLCLQLMSNLIIHSTLFHPEHIECRMGIYPKWETSPLVTLNDNLEKPVHLPKNFRVKS